MKIAVEGCGHGELDKIYETIQFLEQKEGKCRIPCIICNNLKIVINGIMKRNRDDKKMKNALIVDLVYF